MPHPTIASHAEHHKGHTELIRNAIIGFSDGITVPFALTAGLSSLGNSKIVVLGGLAELFAGAISMGLGAFLAATTEKKHYEVEEERERREVKEKPREEEEEIYQIFERYGVGRGECKGVVGALKGREEMWVKFMMDFELQLGPKPELQSACIEGTVMGVAYLVGGLLPLIPYLALPHDVYRALFISIGVTGTILLAFGYVKAKVIGTTHRDAILSALQTLLLGAIAAGAAYGIVRAVNSKEKV